VLQAEAVLCFLGVLAKMKKVTINFIMSECPSVCMEKLGSHWTDFYEC
jgi:hypothetical protein